MRASPSWIVAVAFLLLALPVTAAPDPAPPASESPVDTISMQTFSWGHPVHSWVIHGDGSGEVRARVGNFDDDRMSIRRFQAGSAGFEQIRALMRLPEGHAGRALECELQATDGPYGHATWSHEGQGRRLGYTYGCRSPAADRVYAALGEAEAVVSSWVAQSSESIVPLQELAELHIATLPPPPGPEASIRSISYESGPCRDGPVCPSFRVTVTSDGRGTFEGRRSTAINGRRNFTVTPEQYAAFIRQLDLFRVPSSTSPVSYAGGVSFCQTVAPGNARIVLNWVMNDARQRQQPLIFELGCDPENPITKSMADGLRSAPNLLPIGDLIGNPG